MHMRAHPLVSYQTPASHVREAGATCCRVCGRGAGSAYRGDCLAPDRCPCHKAERLARLRARTGADRGDA